MNILDYIRVRGDLSFKSDPFNDVDNLVFSQMIYAGFDKILKNDEKIRIEELGERFFEDKQSDRKNITYANRDGILVLKEMYKSPRYKDLPVYNYISILHTDTAEQFAAMMVDLPDRTTVVCFKGTDEHMIGWKEDLYLSYKEIAGQNDAVDYVNKHCSILRKYRIIGHSKGGNLAAYAALRCNPLLRMRIEQIISNDGPGLRPGSYDKKEFDKIKDRYRLIAPEKDAIGTIYEIAPKKTIARISTKNIVEAHNILTWQIEANRIAKADMDSYQTDRTRQALVQFLKDTTPEQREIFVEELFKAFDDAKITTVTQLASGGLPILFRVIKELSEMDTIAKNIAVRFSKVLGVSMTSDLHRIVSERKEAFRNNLASLRPNRSNKDENIEIS